MGIGISVGWGVDRGVVAGNGRSDGITFGIDDESDVGSSDVSFDGLNTENPLGYYLDELLD